MSLESYWRSNAHGYAAANDNKAGLISGRHSSELNAHSEIRDWAGYEKCNFDVSDWFAFFFLTYILSTYTVTKCVQFYLFFVNIRVYSQRVV